MGRFAPEDAEAIRAEGLAAAAAVEARAWPLDAGWERWRPDSDWAVAALDPGWEDEPTPA